MKNHPSTSNHEEVNMKNHTIRCTLDEAGVLISQFVAAGLTFHATTHADEYGDRYLIITLTGGY